MEKIWLKNYHSSVPATINADAYPSLVHYFEAKCEQYKDRTAFINFGTPLSFAELEEKSRHFAAYLQESLKLAPGSRVAVMMPNLLQYPVVLFGILRAGMTVVNFNPRYTTHEVQHQLQDCGASCMIVFSYAAHILQNALEGTAVEHVLVTEIGDLFHFLKSVGFNFYLHYVKKEKPWVIPGAKSLLTALKEGQHLNFNRVDVQPSDLAFLQYTGGTTGVAKAAMLTHRNMVANTQQVIALFKSIAHQEELVVTVLPLYHIFALTANCLTFLEFGCPNLLITDPTNLKQTIAELSHHPITVFVGLNTLFNALLNSSKFADLDFSKLHLTFAGGMPTQTAVAERWQKMTGTPIIEGYGLTEASPVVSVNPMTNKDFNGTIGLPLPSTEVSVRNEAGEEVGLETPGELWVRGPQVMQGYWKKPTETAKVLMPEGWLRTGDIVTINARGFLRIIDREKDMVIVSGFNVFPSEVEDIIAQHPGVLEVGVVGVPDPVTGEKLKAVIVRKDLNLKATDIINYCRQELTGYKIPRVIEFRDSLPKSAVGKVLRKELREKLN